MSPTRPARPLAVALTLVVLCAALVGCAGSSIATPSGFVALDEERLHGDKLYQSVSADGAIITLRVQDNETFGTLDFWQEALTRELTRMRGYELVSEEAIAAPASTGQWLHLRGVLEEEIYRYDVAIFLVGDEVYTVETAAPEALYDQHQAAFATAVQSFSLE